MSQKRNCTGLADRSKKTNGFIEGLQETQVLLGRAWASPTLVCSIAIFHEDDDDNLLYVVP